MRLLHAEWKRFFARRLVRIMLGIVLLLLVLVAVGTAHSNQKITPAIRAHAQSMATEQIAQAAQQVTACKAAQSSDNPGKYQLPPGATCDDVFGNGGWTPTASTFMPSTWIFATGGETMLLIFGVVLALFGFTVGASYVGAEWSSGGMANLLLWRPRRLAVLGGKLGALLLSVFASGLAFLVVWLLLLCGIATFRGSYGHMTSGVIQSLALDTSRSSALALVMTAIGFGIASIGRNTASALGIIVGYIVAVEGGGTVVAHLAHISRPERFQLSHYVLAWLYKSQTLYGDSVCSSTTGDCTQSKWFMRMGSAAEVVGILTVAVLAWAFIAMRRRDIT